MDRLTEEKTFAEKQNFTVSVGDSSRTWISRAFKERVDAEKIFAQELWSLVSQGARIVPSRMPRKRAQQDSLLWRRVLVHHQNNQVKLELTEALELKSNATDEHP